MYHSQYCRKSPLGYIARKDMPIKGKSLQKNDISLLVCDVIYLKEVVDIPIMRFKARARCPIVSSPYSTITRSSSTHTSTNSPAPWRYSVCSLIVGDKNTDSDDPGQLTSPPSQCVQGSPRRFWPPPGLIPPPHLFSPSRFAKLLLPRFFRGLTISFGFRFCV